MCFDKPPEALSSRCGSNGITVFYGVAKPGPRTAVVADATYVTG
jgi:hypothetical protein